MATNAAGFSADLGDGIKSADLHTMHTAAILP